MAMYFHTFIDMTCLFTGIDRICANRSTIDPNSMEYTGKYV
jgi:hypothetical protein